MEIEVLGFAAPGLPLASLAIRPPRRGEVARFARTSAGAETGRFDPGSRSGTYLAE